MDTSIKVANTDGGQTATVDIYIGATQEEFSDEIPANSTNTYSYPSTLDGPVRVVRVSGGAIVTSQWTLSGSSNSFNEVMGSPLNQFATEYLFPYYDHGYPIVGGDNMRTWVLVGNPSGSTDAHVHIYIDGVEQSGSPFTISPGSRVTPRWIGTVGGPVHVVSDIPVFTSERVFTVPEDSFNEMMGYPANQLVSEYWFPWYELDQHGQQHLHEQALDEVVPADAKREPGLRPGSRFSCANASPQPSDGRGAGRPARRVLATGRRRGVAA